MTLCICIFSISLQICGEFFCFQRHQVTYFSNICKKQQYQSLFFSKTALLGFDITASPVDTPTPYAQIKSLSQTACSYVAAVSGYQKTTDRCGSEITGYHCSRVISLPQNVSITGIPRSLPAISVRKITGFIS